MSKLLKSAKYFAVVAFALVAVLGVKSASAAYESLASCPTLSVGSTAQVCVMTLQTAVGATADGSFGPLTKAAVMAFQSAHGLAADGVAGPLTKAAIMGANSGVFPAGCTSNSGFSTTTGQSCAVNNTLPAGCTSTAGFSPLTGQSCSGGTSGSTTLTGGAGDITLTSSTTSVVNTVYEGDTNAKIAAFKAKADGSDLAVTSVKVTFQAPATTGSGSSRIDRYISGASVWMGSTKVGSADVADFTKITGGACPTASGTCYSKTISLSNAIVKQNATNTFYVAVDALETINSAELASDMDLDVNTVRYNDATGAILSGDVGSLTTQNFAFDSASANDTTSVTASTANPQAQNFTVKDLTTSDKVLVQAFKLKTGTDAGQIQIDSIPVLVTVDKNTDASGSYDSVIDSLTLTINGTSYDADATVDDASYDTNTGDGTALYTFTFDDGAVVLDGNTSTDVKVYATFAAQNNNYDDQTTVMTSVTGSDVDAESVSNGDVAPVTGSSVSKTHSLSLSAPTFALVGTPTLTSFFHDDSATDVYLAKFVFNVTAGDDAIYLDATGTDVGMTQLGGGAINSVTLDADDSTIDDSTVDGDFLIAAGDTQKFTLSYYIQGNDEADKITLTGFTYGLNDAARDLTVDTGLANFHTASVYLAK